MVFKVGQKVRCIRADRIGDFRTNPGDELVVGVLYAGGEVFGADTGGRWWAEYFEAIPEEPSAPEEPADDGSWDAPPPDAIYRPAYYARYAIEPITFIEANKLPFDVGSIVKYVLRYDAKNGREDVLKARRYCDILLERIDREARVAAGEATATVWSTTL